MPSPSPRRWITLAAIALALYAVVVLVAQVVPRMQRPPAGSAAFDDTSAAVVDEALAQIPPAAVDSAEIKTGWRDEVEGVDLSGLDAAQLRVFVRAANSQMCTCGCGFTLAACRTYDKTCPVSGPRVEALRDSVAQGHVNARGLREPPVHG